MKKKLIKLVHEKYGYTPNPIYKGFGLDRITYGWWYRSFGRNDIFLGGTLKEAIENTSDDE